MPIKNYISPIQMERIEESERAKALLNAGIDLFGIYGIKGTTTRMLADESGSNSAAVTYYFGSKQGPKMRFEHAKEAELVLDDVADWGIKPGKKKKKRSKK